VHLSWSRPLAIYISAFTFLLLACGSETIIDDSCLVDLAPISARTNVVTVGDTLTFEATLGPAECLPTNVDFEDWRWSSTDTLIARIDSLTGLAEGVSPGDVGIQVEHAVHRSVASVTGLQVKAE
jgi:Bacterial Ig-like domain (group 2)